MIKFGKYEVFFKHRQDEFGVLQSKDNIPATEYAGTTECFIVEDGEHIGHGKSFCSVRDNFNKSVGRKVSLTKALAGMSKELRTAVWEEYFKLSPRE